MIGFRLLLLGFIFSAALLADTGTLKKVVDGDTLYFYSHGDTVKCRIAWIDTPESHRNERAKRKARLCLGVTLDRMVQAGKEATAYGKTLVENGRTYHYDVIGKDRYGRSICIVRLNDMAYNEKMVQEGYAAPFWKYIPKKMKRRFKKLAVEAKSRETGLWREYRPVMECLSR